MKQYYYLGAVLTFLYVPQVVLAQNPIWLTRFFTDLFGLIPLVITALIGLALIVFLIGLVRFIAQSGDEKAVTEGKKYMIWGVVGLFSVLAVWGLVTLLQQITGTTNNTTPPAPTTNNPLL